MITTISILGDGTAGFALSRAFAAINPDGYLVDVFSHSPQWTARLREAIRPKNPLHIYFSKSAGRSAWGADIVVIDMPQAKILPVLQEIESAANDRAWIILAQPDAQRVESFLKNSHLRSTTGQSREMKRIWQGAGIVFPAAAFRIK